MCYPWWQMFYLALITALGMLKCCCGPTCLVSIATNVKLARQTLMALQQALMTVSILLSIMIHHSSKWHAQMVPARFQLSGITAPGHIPSNSITSPVALACSQTQPAHDK